MNWNKSKILITGADGFIASHLVERLVAKDAHAIEETISKWLLVFWEKRE